MLVAFAAITAVLLVANAATAFLLRSFLLDRIDQTLRTMPVAAPEFLLGSGLTPPCAAAEVADAVIAVGGRDLCDRAAVPVVEGERPVLSPGEWSDPLDGRTESGTLYRVRLGRTEAGEELLVGLSLADTQRVLQRVGVLQLVASLLVLATVGGAAQWLLRRGIRPLVGMAATADAIAAGERGLRVPAGRDDEVGRVGRAMNGMLDQVERSLAAQEASEQRLRRFVEDASHELRTPLTTIQGYSDLHLQGMLADPARLDGAMTRINAEAVRMNRLVTDMLTLARLDDEPRLTTAQIDLADVLRIVAVDVAATDPDRPLTVDAPDPVPVVADPDAVTQIAANLVGNARMHTPAGTPIHLSARAAAGVVELTVDDEGPGIPPDVLPRVFERFVRADPARSRASGGSGLGLSIVKLLAEAHGGSVVAEPRPGGGARFVVRLPEAGPSA
jgi:two-component system OmpR family sensor kinase